MSLVSTGGKEVPVSVARELLEQLVAIDSVNPELVPGAPGELEIARFVAAWLERAGLEVTLQEVAAGRPNVLATARGSGGGRSLMLNAHTDTVGHGGMDEPLRARLEGTRLYGRGAYDMKGSLAAIMIAGARAVERHLEGDVVVAAVVDEEFASIGSASLNERLADAAIVTEPTEMKVAVAHKGFVAFEITTEGAAAHGSRPDLGRDAIARMGSVLVRLEELGRSLAASGEHPLLGTGSVHASTIEGGQEYSSYPERCLLRGERRTIPGETVRQVEGEIEALLGDLEGTARVVVARAPFEIDENALIARTVRRHAGDAEVVGVAYWADSAILASAGMPTVLFGPSGEGAHANVEWVDLGDVERCADIYVSVAEEFCTRPDPT
jgi:acetylornithine deacetylase